MHAAVKGQIKQAVEVRTAFEKMVATGHARSPRRTRSWCSARGTHMGTSRSSERAAESSDHSVLWLLLRALKSHHTKAGSKTNMSKAAHFTQPDVAPTYFIEFLELLDIGDRRNQLGAGVAAACAFPRCC